MLSLKLFSNPISISNICQKFYILKSNIEENQNLEPIYYRFQNLKLKTQNLDLKVKSLNLNSELTKEIFMYKA